MTSPCTARFTSRRDSASWVTSWGWSRASCSPRRRHTHATVPTCSGLSDFYLGWLAGLTFRYEAALAQFDLTLSEAPDGAYRHIIEADRAWALLCLGRVEEAAQAVDENAASSRGVAVGSPQLGLRPDGPRPHRGT